MAATETLPDGHPGEIILFSFPESVYGRRMVRYLDLRVSRSHVIHVHTKT